MTQNEAHAVWMSQYIGQIAVHTGIGKPMRGIPKRAVITFDNIERILFSTQRSIELRLINQLTDEETTLIGFENSRQLNDYLIDSGTFEVFIKRYLSFSHCQILLQLGILMPFSYIENGTIHHLSPIQILEKGWAREKEFKNIEV